MPQLKETVNLPSLSVNVNIEITRGSRQTRNRLYVSGKCVPKGRESISRITTRK